MEAVWQVVGQAHLPGVHHMNVQACENGSEHPVALQRVPVAVGQGLVKRQRFRVGGPDYDHRVWSSVQQPHHRPTDALQPADVHLHGVSAEVRPDADDYGRAPASGQAVQLVGDVTELAGGDINEADGRAVAAVRHQDVAFIM